MTCRNIEDQICESFPVTKNKYLKYYCDIIDQAKKRILLDQYYEKHHYIPRSLGGTDEYIVRLSAREHFICHRLLEKFTVGIAHQKMSYALWRLTNQNKVAYKITARTYANVRTIHAQTLSTRMSGDLNPNYQRIFSPEYKQKLRQARKRKPPITYGFRGRNHSDKTKQSMSKSKKGTKNPNYQGIYVTPWGKYQSAMQAALHNQEYKFSETKILKFCKNNEKIVNNLHVFRNPYFTENDKGKTFRELGFDFLREKE